MDPSEFRVILDDRPIHETAATAWCDAADIDVVWWCSTGPTPEPEAVQALPAPLLSMSPIDVAAATREAPAAGLRVLIVIDEIALLRQAVRLGLPPMRLIVASYASPDDGRRLSSEVSLDRDDHRYLCDLFALGFDVTLQSRPNVTPRPIPSLEAG